MKVLVTADLHLLDTGSGILRDPESYEYRWEALERVLVEIPREHRNSDFAVSEIWILGDLFQTARNFRKEFLQRIQKILHRSLEIPGMQNLRILSGNHDFSTDPRKYGSASPLERLREPGIHVYTEPTETEIEGTQLWLPFGEIPREKLLEAPDILLAHHTVSGADLQDCILEFDDRNFLEALGGAEFALSGHVHYPQALTLENPGRALWTYVGAPCSVGYKNVERPRILLLDTRTRELQSLRLPESPQGGYASRREIIPGDPRWDPSIMKMKEANLNPDPKNKKENLMKSPNENGSSKEIRVFLSGAISHRTWAEATEWRRNFTRELREVSSWIVPVNPFRGIWQGESDENMFPMEPKYYIQRGKADIQRCHAVLVGDSPKGRTEISVGTAVEIGMAHALGLPVFALRNAEATIRFKYVQEIAVAILEDEAEAAQAISQWFQNERHVSQTSQEERKFS